MLGDTKLRYGLSNNGVNSPEACVKTVVLLYFFADIGGRHNRLITCLAFSNCSRIRYIRNDIRVRRF